MLLCPARLEAGREAAFFYGSPSAWTTGAHGPQLRSGALAAVSMNEVTQTVKVYGLATECALSHAFLNCPTVDF